MSETCACAGYGKRLNDLTPSDVEPIREAQLVPFKEQMEIFAEYVADAIFNLPIYIENHKDTIIAGALSRFIAGYERFGDDLFGQPIGRIVEERNDELYDWVVYEVARIWRDNV
jgi:hypothetical protein